MMAIHLALRPYQRRFRQPLQTAHGLWHWRRGLILRLADDRGRVGYGEVAPLPWFGTETLAEALAFLSQLGPGQVTEPLPNRLPSCQFGLGAARWMLDHPQDLEGSPPDQGPTSALLPAGAAALDAWQTPWQQGLRTLKWKIGLASPGEEIPLLQQLVQTLPATAALRLDANGGLTEPRAQDWLQVCDRINNRAEGPRIEYLEQPLPATAMAAMGQLARQYQTPLALDESVVTADQLQRCQQLGWPGVLVVKPAIAGDPQRLRQVWGTGGAPLVFSSVFETGVGRRVALALAHQYQQQTGQSLALGFDTLNRFEDDWDQLSPDQLWQRL